MKKKLIFIVLLIILIIFLIKYKLFPNNYAARGSNYGSSSKGIDW